MPDRAGGPPKCGCGLYAVGECVDCDLALCSAHGAMTGERFRCDKHDRKARTAELREAKANRARRAAQEAERSAQLAGERQAEIDRADEIERLATKERAEAARRKAAASRAAEAARADARLAKEERERARVEFILECERWKAAGIADPDLVAQWTAIGFSLDMALIWRASGFAPASAREWRLAFRRRASNVVTARHGEEYAAATAQAWHKARRTEEEARQWGFIPFAVARVFMEAGYEPAVALLEVKSGIDSETEALLLDGGFDSLDAVALAERRDLVRPERQVSPPHAPTLETCSGCGSAVDINGSCPCRF